MTVQLKTAADYNTDHVFIIGGGPSLRGFNWPVLSSHPVIGCNHAFRLGIDVCDVCVFGDHKFFERFHGELQDYEGPVVTNNRHLYTKQKELSWITCMPYEKFGLHKHALGWNGNTGSVAINLAVHLGFTEILLLGFDMALNKDREPNYHKHVIDIPSDEAYKRFLKGFRHLKRDLDAKYPEVRVLNLNPDSYLNCFPQMSFNDYMEGRGYAVVA